MYEWLIFDDHSVCQISQICAQPHPPLGNSGNTQNKKPPTSCASWKIRTSFTFQWLELRILLQFQLNPFNLVSKARFFWSTLLPNITPKQHPQVCFSFPKPAGCRAAIWGHQIRTLQVSGSTVGGFQLRRPPTWTQAAVASLVSWLVGWLVATRNATKKYWGNGGVFVWRFFLESLFPCFLAVVYFGKWLTEGKIWIEWNVQGSGGE